MQIDWIRFLEDHNIPYVSKGRNVKKGHINVKCPFCGSDDPSEHMGIHLSQELYGCWRSAAHAGKKPHNLIRALLGCSFGQSKLIAAQYSQADPETFEDAVALLQGHDSAPTSGPRRRSRLHMPDNFNRIVRTGTAKRFWHYLERRGFDDVRGIVSEYNLKYATTGPHKDRIIFPIYQDGELVSWTGRAIMHVVDAPRYKILGMEEEVGPSATVDRNQLVYNADECRGGDILFVVEGPIDVLKLDFYGVNYNVNACCPLGTRMSTDQAYIIGRIGRRYRRRILLYDPTEVETVFLASDLLMGAGFEVGEYPSFVTEDVGALTPTLTQRLVRSFL